ncbi:hypothetical protein ACMFMF_011516 [Clarireedia jacksonii]
MVSPPINRQPANPSTASDLVPTIHQSTAESCINVATNGTVIVNGTNTNGAGDTTVPPAKTQTGLSHGAVAGIAVGIVSVVALLAVVGWYMFRRKRQGVKAPEVAYHSPPAFVPDSTIAGIHEVGGDQSRHEMAARKLINPIQEMP